MVDWQSLHGAGVPFKETTAAGTSLVLSAVACQFFGAYLVGATGVAGWLLVYDLAAAPADGAGQTPFAAVPVAQAGVANIEPTFFGHPCQNGCVVVFSTTGPYTQTTTGGNAQFIAGQVR